MTNVIQLPRLDPRKDASPAELYLARLRPGSRRAQLGALKVCMGILQGEVDLPHPHWYPWHTLTPAQSGRLRAAVVSTYAPATARRILSALRGVVRCAWQLGLLDSDQRDRICDIAPVKGSRLPAGRALSPAEVQALFEAADWDDAMALALLLGAGLRRAEAVDLQAHAIAVETKDRAQGQGTGPAPRKGGGPVPSPRSPESLVRIVLVGKGSKERALYVAGYAGALLALVAGAPGPVLVTRSTSGLWRRLARLARRAGVPPFTPHDLRRTYASRALARVDLATVQATMGHADPRTTARYDRRGDDALRAAALALASHSQPVLP